MGEETLAAWLRAPGTTLRLGATAISAIALSAGVSVAAWLAAVGQPEALCSLAGFAWEHPDDVYPVVEEGDARFEAEGLGHPLIPEARCVRNDVALGGATSHDRRLGAAGIVRGLVQRGAIGLVTTHDLALSEVANESNALALMRTLGLSPDTPPS